jgi:hypothetical protein
MQSSCFSFGYREGANATSTAPIFSTAADLIHREFRTSARNHNPATPCPNSRPNRGHQCSWDKTQKGMGMTEQQDNAALEREEIATRLANFKATQEKFEREREEYFVTTLENARLSEGARHSIERPPFWS